MRVSLWFLIVMLTVGGSASAQPVTITALDASQAAPYSTLEITGTGFSPSNSAISVLILSNAGATSTCSSPRGAKSPTIVPIAVPAFAATSTTLTIVVPPVMNVANGAFTASAVKVQVVQVSKTTVNSSTIASGLCVSNMPQVPAKVPAGAVTRGYLNIGLNVLTDTINGAKSSFRSKLTTLRNQQQTLEGQVDAIVENPRGSVRFTLTTKDGNPFILDSEMLAEI